MSAWLKDETTLHPGAAPHRGVDIFALLRDQVPDHTGSRAVDPADHQAAQVTASGAAWLAGASAYPRSTLSQWEARPGSPGVLPCGSAFDVVSVPALFGRRMLEQLWAEGPGSGPVATHRGRMLLFAAPGTAQRLPSLLAWEEWGTGSTGRSGAHRGSVPPLLCHGTGDAVTVPPLVCGPGSGSGSGSGSSAGSASGSGGPRWVVAPDTRNPWLPGPDVLLWACLRVGRSAAPSTTGNSIFLPADPGANVYDVTRRR